MIDGTLHRGLRLITFILALCGAILMGGLFYVVTFQPQLIEAKLQSFAIQEVEALAKEALAGAQDAALESENGLLQSLAGRLTDNAEVLIVQRDAAVAALVRSVAVDRCEGECSTAQFRTAVAAAALQSRVANMQVGQTTVGEFIVQRYEATVSGLKADLSTFSLANLVAFISLMFLAAFRGRFGARILPMTLLLTAYVGAAMYWYVFTQDWASAILFNNLIAGTYVATMIIVYIFLIDWTFLRGRITQVTLDGIGSMLSNFSP